ncbi:hypothetical protein [Streptomyces sp. CAI-85]|uniref:hypothetical protein n=1 Tax=Streptomyces sp. CAI-85 TaxID=1472662 RepID=UPI0035C9944C
MAVIKAIGLLITIVSVVWEPLVSPGPFLALLALWAVGSKQQAAPQWALPAHVRNGKGVHRPRRHREVQELLGR